MESISEQVKIDGNKIAHVVTRALKLFYMSSHICGK